MLVDVTPRGQRDTVVERAGEYLGVVTFFPSKRVYMHSGARFQEFASERAAIVALVKATAGAPIWEAITLFHH